MANLTAALARTYMQGDIDDLPVKASSAIFEGSAIGNASGYHRHLAATDKFAGFALTDVASVGADGGDTVRVRTKGRIVLTVASVAVTDIGKPVYASDGNAFTLTASTNTHIGRVVSVFGTNLAVVEFDAHRAGFGGNGIAELTDSSGGTASDTLAAITGAYVEATIENTVASLAAKINAIIRQLG
jgi:hypothetical protein